MLTGHTKTNEIRGGKSSSTFFCNKREYGSCRVLTISWATSSLLLLISIHRILFLIGNTHTLRHSPNRQECQYGLQDTETDHSI